MMAVPRGVWEIVVVRVCMRVCEVLAMLTATVAVVLCKCG